MKRKTIILVVASAMLLVASTPVLAANGGAPDAGCQVGADSQIIGGWKLYSQSEFAAYLTSLGRDPGDAAQQAETTYAFCDHNNDGYACVMTQSLPNDHSGSDFWWLLEDNHPYGGK